MPYRVLVEIKKPRTRKVVSLDLRNGETIRLSAEKDEHGTMLVLSHKDTVHVARIPKIPYKSISAEIKLEKDNLILKPTKSFLGIKTKKESEFKSISSMDKPIPLEEENEIRLGGILDSYPGIRIFAKRLEEISPTNLHRLPVSPRKIKINPDLVKRVTASLKKGRSKSKSRSRKKRR